MSQQMTIKQFAATIRLRDVLTHDGVTEELYGYKRFVVDQKKLSRLLLDAKFEGGFAELLSIIQARLDAVQD